MSLVLPSQTSDFAIFSSVAFSLFVVLFLILLCRRVEVDCGTKAQAMEREREGQKAREEHGGSSHRQHHYQQQQQPQASQSELQWNHQASNPPPSPPAPASSGRNTRNSGTKRKR